MTLGPPVAYSYTQLDRALTDRAPAEARDEGMEMTRTFAMKVYAGTYWLLSLLFVYILVVLVLPAIATGPEAAPFVVLIVGFLALFVLGAALSTFWPSAPRRGALWLLLLIVPVLFLLLNAPFLVFPLTHPSDIGFTAILPLLVGTIVLVWSGVVAFREARSGSMPAGASWRARIAIAVVAGATAGAFATGVLAAKGGGGSGTVAGAPTVTNTLTAENTKYLTTSYSMGSSDVLGLFVENKDGFAHSFDIDALNIHVQIPANSTVAVAIKPASASPLEFYCAVPGHRDAGMAGIIQVQ